MTALVRDCMTCSVVVETPDATMAKLTAVMRLRRISAVPIVRDGALEGIVSTTDVLRAAPTACAADSMSTVVVTAAENERVADAARRFVAGRLHHLVVVDGQRVSGMLSPCDVIRVLRHRRIVEPVASVMTAPVESIDVGESVREAVRRLTGANGHALVVVDGERPIGVFTHDEALAARRLPDGLSSTVESVMSAETICVDELTPVYRVAAYFASMNLRRILIVEHRHLVGIVSAIDVADVLARAPAMA